MQPLSLSDHSGSGKFTTGKNRSCWFDPEILIHQFVSLSSNQETEVVIIGDGIAGFALSVRARKLL